MTKAPTKAQRARWQIAVEYGCVICGAPAEIHHCETGAGGRKNHDKFTTLCYNHHRGAQGIHTMGRRPWQAIYGTEQELMERTNKIIDAHC